MHVGFQTSVLAYSRDMEAGNMVVEENSLRGDSSTSASKILGPLVKIDAISIDLGIAMDKNKAGKCQHFSIRGYVSEMREKDMNICSPFAMDDDSSMSDKHISVFPPLYVPKFRWWSCQNCLEQMPLTSASDEIGAVPNTSTDMALGKRCLSSCKIGKGNRSDVGDVNGTAHGNCLEGDVNREIGNPISGVTRSNVSPLRETKTGGTVFSKSKSSGLGGTSGLNNGNHDTADVGPIIEFRKCTAGSIDEASLEKCQTTGHPSELQECDTVSTESDEIMAGTRIGALQIGNSNGVLRRKTRKVRLLTELLGGKRKQESDRQKMENPSNGINEASARSPQGAQEKRKINQDHEDCKTPEMNLPFLAKEDGASRGDESIETSSESNEDASRGVGLQAGIKRQRTKLIRDRRSTLDKMKHKQTHLNGEYSPMVPWAETSGILHTGTGVLDKCDAAAEASFLKSAHDALMGEGMEPCLTSYTSMQHIGRKSNSAKKKSKMAQVEDKHASLMPPSNSPPGEVPIKRKDVKYMRIGSERVNVQSADNVSVKTRVDPSPNSYMPAEWKDKGYMSHMANKIDPLLIQQKGMNCKDLWRREGVYVGESSLCKSAPDPSLGQGLLHDLEKRVVPRMAILNAKQNCSSLIKEQSFHLHKKSDFSGPYSNEKTIKTKGHSAVSEEHKNARRATNKVFERGTSDDIPMEIVELMAKNQYERGLSEAEKNYILSESTNNKRKVEIMGFPQVHSNRVIRSSQKEHTSEGKSTNFSHFRRNYINMGQVVEKEKPGFTIYSEFGQEIPFSASSGSIRNSNVQNCEWIGDNRMAQRPSLANVQVIEAYNLCHSHSRTNQKNEEYKRSSMQPNRQMHAEQIEPLHKGKTMRDFDLNSLNLNVPSEEMQTKSLDFESFRMTPSEYPTQSRIETNPKSMGSLEPYSNDTIPAMQLLSLMDAANPSTTPFGIDPKKINHKPFSPCNYHPKVTIDGSRNFIQEPLFSYHHHHHSKKYPGLGHGVLKTADSLRQLSSPLYVKPQMGKSCECSPLASQTQNNIDFRKPANFTGQISFKSREKERSPSGVSCTTVNFNSSQNKQRGNSGGPDSMLFPFQCLRLEEESTKCSGSEARTAVWPLISLSENDICCVNRNPAEFSVPEAGNMYTISGEDLKFGKKNRLKGKSASMNGEERKRSKVTKLKKHAQDHI